MISLEVSLSRLTALNARTFPGRLAYRRHAETCPLEVSIPLCYLGWVGRGRSGREGLPLPSHQNERLPITATIKMIATIAKRKAIFTVFLSSLKTTNAVAANAAKKIRARNESNAAADRCRIK